MRVGELKDGNIVLIKSQTELILYTPTEIDANVFETDGTLFDRNTLNYGIAIFGEEKYEMWDDAIVRREDEIEINE